MSYNYILLLIAFLLTGFNVDAQKLKKVKQLSDNGLYKEIYTVDKISLVKQGKYSKIKVRPWTLLEKGMYKDGEKHGEWFYYESKDFYWQEIFKDGRTNQVRKLSVDGKICARGKMVDGEKKGIWNFWDVLDNRLLVYNFDENEVLWVKDDMKFNANTSGNDNNYINEFVKPNGTMPFTFGGHRRMLTEIEKMAIYPVDDYNKPIRGKAVLGFTITKHGNVHSPKILESDHELMSQELLRMYNKVIQNLKWFPATINGEFVEFQFKFPLDFTGKNADE